MKTMVTLALLAGLATAGGGGKIKWQSHKNYDAALQEAKESGKPVVLYFTADF